ncbi:tetratricopeptidedomain 4 [Trypanosoma theileri]|uniref:Tetratricopeptidedomain 4 n=1 Tax=Trypanosoma theileri TaxID=67003 RepID=A0A1X0P0Q3_9TRYP|nr:tetratricopeptidedomain 4 [Trypanosoma theileri]ORC90526.1 tetratricopeptidedomain 4 [Trypanosoma theileri]
MNLEALVPAGRTLTEEQQQHVRDLQDEIDEIWSRRGDYKIDDSAWEHMPLFMENITEEDLQKNADCAALASIAYDAVPPEEIAENRKQHGNRAIQLALDPAQVNKENLARAAAHCYTEGLNAKCADPVLNAQLYANRSLAQYIIQNYGHGLEDAQRAIILNPNYSKAYYRAARCAERVKKYELALDLISKGCQTIPPPAEEALKEFAQLERVCRESLENAHVKEKKKSLRTRVQAAETSNVLRTITSRGIKLSPHPEVSSEQMGVYGQHKPYFDTEGLLHVPILFMYDEYQQTDFMQDVACDVSAADLVEELMPFPWDDKGRYSQINDIVVIFKIDDGVKMPEYYEVDLSWPLMEVFRLDSYKMPMLLPVLHILCKDSELLQEWNVQKAH